MSLVPDTVASLPLARISDYVLENADELDHTVFEAVKDSYKADIVELGQDNKAMILSDLLKLDNDFKKRVEITTGSIKLAISFEK